MKRILLISPQYYPCNSPCSYRIHSFAKYLPRYGYSPTILTLAQNEDMVWILSYRVDPSLEGLDVCRTERIAFPWPKRSSANIFKLRRFPLTWPPGLTELMVKRAEGLHEEESYDAILATAPLWFTLSVAARLGERFSIPWVADCRDVAAEHSLGIKWNCPWQWRHWLYQAWLIHQESKVCRTAAATITVSRHLVDLLASRRIPNVHLVTNGFDPDDYKRIVKTGSKIFRIVYSGGMMGGADPTPLFDALDLLLGEQAFPDNDFEVCFYGKSNASVERYLQGHPCKSIVYIKGLKPRAEVQSITVDAALLLQLAYPNKKGITTSKIFEYLGAARPIIAVPRDGDVIDALLAETGAGVSATTPREIADIIAGFYREWKKTGRVTYHANSEAVSRYTRQAQAKNLGKILDSVLTHGGSGKRAT